MKGLPRQPGPEMSSIRMGSLKQVLKVESTHEAFVNDVATRDQKKVNDIWDHVHLPKQCYSSEQL